MESVPVQFLLSYPEDMTRDQAMKAVSRRLGPVTTVDEEDAPTRSDGKIHDVLTIGVRPAVAEKLDRDGYWQARAGDVLIEAAMP